MIDHLDHLVLTTTNEAACIDFYTRVLGMSFDSFVGGTPPIERRAFSTAIRRSICMSKAVSSNRRHICRCRVRWICALSPACRSTK